MKRVLVPLAPGFEETEAVAVIDVLRRADVEVVVASAGPGSSSTLVEGAHGIAVAADAALDDVRGEAFDMLVLAGGMPGTTHLAEDERVLELVRAMHAAGRTTAAICAAPLVLAAAGVAGGVALTSHPSVRERLTEASAEVVAEPRVVRTGSIVTSQGPGTALEFALALVAELVGEARAEELARAMLVRA